MENASKALLIAGGVLIAIILITILTRTYTNIGAFQRERLSEEEVARIEEDNKAYTKYLKRYIYGTEVISIVNKVSDYQEKLGKEFEITIISISETINICVDGSNRYKFLDKYQNTETWQKLKDKAFLCTNVGYDNSSGRVNSITFVEKSMKNME